MLHSDHLFKALSIIKQIDSRVFLFHKHVLKAQTVLPLDSPFNAWQSASLLSFHSFFLKESCHDFFTHQTYMALSWMEMRKCHKVMLSCEKHTSIENSWLRQIFCCLLTYCSPTTVSQNIQNGYENGGNQKLFLCSTSMLSIFV